VLLQPQASIVQSLEECPRKRQLLRHPQSQLATRWCLLEAQVLVRSHDLGGSCCCLSVALLRSTKQLACSHSCAHMLHTALKTGLVLDAPSNHGSANTMLWLQTGLALDAQLLCQRAKRRARRPSRRRSKSVLSQLSPAAPDLCHLLTSAACLHHAPSAPATCLHKPLASCILPAIAAFTLTAKLVCMLSHRIRARVKGLLGLEV
jgi:hypothetical protein